MILQEAMLKDKTKFILGLCITLVFIFVVIQFPDFKKNSNSVLDQSIISMTEKGFEPEEIIVSIGTKVTFINKDKVFRWPASDLHPTHTIYLAFDSKAPMKPGDFWEFTFDKAGVWNYHDHLSPFLTGKIVVE